LFIKIEAFFITGIVAFKTCKHVVSLEILMTAFYLLTYFLVGKNCRAIFSRKPHWLIIYRPKKAILFYRPSDIMQWWAGTPTCHDWENTKIGAI